MMSPRFCASNLPLLQNTMYFLSIIFMSFGLALNAFWERFILIVCQIFWPLQLYKMSILRHVKYQDRICYLCIPPSRFVPTQPFLIKNIKSMFKPFNNLEAKSDKQI